MDVILKQDLDNLGEKDEVVNVKPGYARNFLFPRGYALPATTSNRKVLEETLRQRSHKEEKLKEEARKAADKLKKQSLKIGAKVGDQGKIFGSVNAIQLADQIKSFGFPVERKNITIKGEPIKTTGQYEAEVRFHKEVIETISFEVVEE